MLHTYSRPKLGREVFEEINSDLHFFKDTGIVHELSCLDSGLSEMF